MGGANFEIGSGLTLIDLSASTESGDEENAGRTRQHRRAATIPRPIVAHPPPYAGQRFQVKEDAISLTRRVCPMSLSSTPSGRAVRARRVWGNVIISEVSLYASAYLFLASVVSVSSAESCPPSQLVSSSTRISTWFHPRTTRKSTTMPTMKSTLGLAFESRHRRWSSSRCFIDCKAFKSFSIRSSSVLGTSSLKKNDHDNRPIRNRSSLSSRSLTWSLKCEEVFTLQSIF